MEAVINLRHEPRLREEFEYAQVVNNTVLVDRRSKWGNPWRVGRDGTREEVIARYRADLWRRIRSGEIALDELAALDGCWLACSATRSRATAMCSPARRPGRRRCWRSGPMRDAPPCFPTTAVPPERPMGSVQVERYSPSDVIVHCAMCALCDNRLRRSSAALRRGQVPLGDGSGRPWLRPKLRHGSFLARLH